MAITKSTTCIGEGLEKMMCFLLLVAMQINTIIMETTMAGSL